LGVHEKRLSFLQEGLDVLSEQKFDIKEEVNASKETVSGDDVWTLLASASVVYVASGQKILEFAPQEADREKFLKKVTGRTGNLRAPTLRVGKDFYVGFNVGLYERIAEMK
jgi:hypothetical protein